MSNIGGTIKSIQIIMWHDTGLNGDEHSIEQLSFRNAENSHLHHVLKRIY